MGDVAGDTAGDTAGEGLTEDGVDESGGSGEVRFLGGGAGGSLFAVPGEVGGTAGEMETLSLSGTADSGVT